MDINELASAWKKEQLPNALQEKTMIEFDQLNKNIQKENTILTYLFSGTIFFLGFFVFPLLPDQNTMIACSALWFLMGFQAILFWMRNFDVKQSMIKNPKKFISSQILKLKYNLWVTNFFMPCYLILLGLISSAYIFYLFSNSSNKLTYTIISLMWIFYITIFFFSWRKQRKKDETNIIPKINELQKIREGFGN